MRFDILTIFPEMFVGPLTTSIIGRARQNERVTIETHDIRSYSDDKHRRVDDAPFGGGAGMVMKAQPFFTALREGLGLTSADREEGPTGAPRNDAHVVLLAPQGSVFTQAKAAELAAKKRVVLLCGHYEGIDDRVRQVWVDEELSIGDYVLTGGELAAMVVIDAVVRLLPGVLGDESSAKEESFAEPLLEYPHYTRPALFEGLSVPEVLISGHHGRIEQWRRKESLVRTYLQRPDLIRGSILSGKDRTLLAEGLLEQGWEGPSLASAWQALGLGELPGPASRRRGRRRRDDERGKADEGGM